MGVASAGNERKIYETASWDVPVCLRMPITGNGAAHSRSRIRTYQVYLACGPELQCTWAVTHSLRSNGADRAFGSPATRPTRRSLGSLLAFAGPQF